MTPENGAEPAFSMSIHRHMIAGGAAPEAEVSQKLAQYAKTISGIESECINAYAEVWI